MAQVTTILTGFGLSASAGLNAYIPLLLIALGARLFPEAIRLGEPYALLTSPWVIGALTLLLVVEVLADKVPAVDHVNDLLGWVVRPTAAAILFGATTGSVAYLDPGLGLALGFIIGGATHAAKATARPMVTATTGGMGNPVVSMLEDVAALVTSLVALAAPILIGVAAVLFGLLFVVWLGRNRRQRVRPAGGDPSTVG